MWLDAWVSTQNIVISNNFFPRKKSSNLERFTASIKFSFYDHQMKKWNLSKGSAARALWNSLWELNRQGSFLAWSYQRQRKSDGKNHRENSMNRSHYHYLPIYVERNIGPMPMLCTFSTRSKYMRLFFTDIHILIRLPGIGLIRSNGLN